MKLLPIALALLAAPALAAPVCEARSGDRPPAVIELFTSEGCSSCPPAEAWLNTLRGREGVVALAFHVDYWNSIGWKDRFATAATTARQYDWQRALGAPNVYTPQVLLDGRDWRGWGDTTVPAPRATNGPSVQIERDGDALSATVGPIAGADRLSGYWAVLEDGISTKVRAGENAGRTLHHDHVVRFYKRLPAWPARQPQQLKLQLEPGSLKPGHRVVLVIDEPGSMRPLQAVVAPGC